MGGKPTASGGKSSVSKGALKTSKVSSTASRPLGRYNETKWHVTDYKPQRKIKDEELAAAKNMFFLLDTDNSGSIDADELGVMLRGMGKDPSEQELLDLIASVDEGDKDGKIQLREFLKLYTNGLDSKSAGSREDVDDVFTAISALATGDAAPPKKGDTKEKVESVTKDAIMSGLHDVYGIDMTDAAIEDCFSLHSSKGSEITREEMGNFLTAPPGALASNPPFSP